MPRKCTRQEELFCLEYVRTGGDRYAALDKGYPKSVKWKPRVRTVKAHALLTRETVQARIAELMEPVIRDARCSLENHLHDLMRIREMALVFGKFNAAVRAEHFRGRAAGHYVEQVAHLHGIAAIRVPEKSADAKAWLQTWAPPLRRPETIEHQPEPDDDGSDG